MKTYSTDADLAKWEPALFRDLAVPGQRLCRGDDGTTDGLQFTSLAADFVTCRLAPGHVLRLWSVEADNLDSGDAGVYEIISVESPTRLLATHVGMADAESPVELPANPADSVGPGDPVPWSYAVDTFQVQAEEAAFALITQLGISAQEAETLDAAILSPRVLRRSSVFAVLAMVHQAAAGVAAEGGNLAAKAALYRDMYQREVARLRVSLDRNGDGLPDETRLPGAIRLRRD